MEQDKAILLSKDEWLNDRILDAAQKLICEEIGTASTFQRVLNCPVQRQPDGYNCGLFAIAFAAEILDGKSPSEAIFSVDEMRGHLISCLEMKKMKPFS